MHRNQASSRENQPHMTAAALDSSDLDRRSKGEFAKNDQGGVSQGRMWKKRERKGNKPRPSATEDHCQKCRLLSKDQPIGCIVRCIFLLLCQHVRCRPQRAGYNRYISWSRESWFRKKKILRMKKSGDRKTSAQRDSRSYEYVCHLSSIG